MKNNLQEEIIRLKTLMNLKEGVDPKDAYKIYQEVAKRWGGDQWKGIKNVWNDITGKGIDKGEDIYKIINLKEIASGKYFDEFDKIYKELGEKVGRNLDGIITKGGKNLTDEELKVLELFQNLINKEKQQFTQAEKVAINTKIAETAVKGPNMNRFITDTIQEAETELTTKGIKGVKGNQLIDNVLKNVISKWETATGKKMPQEMINKLREQIMKDPKFQDLVKNYGDDVAKEAAEKEAKELAEKEAELERLAKEKAEKEAFGENWRENLMPEESWTIKVIDFMLGRNDTIPFLTACWNWIIRKFHIDEIADRMIVQVQKWRESGFFSNFNSFKANVDDTTDMTNRFTRSIRAVNEDPKLSEVQKKIEILKLYRQYRRYTMKVTDPNMDKAVRDQLFKAHEYIEQQLREGLALYRAELRKSGAMTEEEIAQQTADFEDLIKWFTTSKDKYESVQDRLKIFLEKMEKESIGGKQIGTWNNIKQTIYDILGLSYKTTDEYYDELVVRAGDEIDTGGKVSNKVLTEFQSILAATMDFLNKLWPRLYGEGAKMNWNGKEIWCARWPIVETIGQKLLNKFWSGCFSDFDVLTRYWTRYGYFKGSLALFMRGTMIFYVYLPLIGSLVAAFISVVQSQIPQGPIGDMIREGLGSVAAWIANPKDAIFDLLGNDEAKKNYELKKDFLDDARKSYVLGVVAEITLNGLVERGASNIPFYNTLLSFTNISGFDDLKSEIKAINSGGIGSGLPNFIGMVNTLWNIATESAENQDSTSEMSKNFENERQKILDQLNKLGGKTVKDTFPTVKTVLDKKVEKAKEAKEQIQYCTITKAQSNLITSLMTYDPYFDTKLGNINAKDVNMIQNMEFLAANAVYATGVLLNGKFFNLVHCEGGLLPILKRGENGLYGAETTSDGKLALSGVVNYKNLGSKLTMGKGNNQCYCPLCWFLYDGENGQWYTIEGWAQTFIPTGKVDNIKQQVEKADAEDVWFDFSKGFTELIKYLKKIYESQESIKYWKNVLNNPEYQEREGGKGVFGLQGKYTKKYANLRQRAKNEIQEQINDTEELLKSLDELSKSQNTRVQALKSQNTKASLELVEKIKQLYIQNDIKFDENTNISLREDVKRWMSVNENRRLNKNIINERYLLGNRNMRSRHIFENEDEQRFGENKFDHWYDTFTFQKYDEKTGDFKDIETDSLKHGKIKERFNDFIKNYDGDDAFVRAVVDTHPEVSRFKYLKDQANIQEAYYPTGLASILSVIRESKGEYEIFSVSRQKGGNWNLVKGDFTQKEMSNMVLTKQIPPEKKPKERENGLESLKKKEATGTNSLRNDEKEGLKNLPKKVKEKVQEKISRGWTTELPPKIFKDFYEESEISSVFNEKIPIYKLEATPEFFRSLQKNSSHVLVRRGFCRSLLMAKNDSDINSEQRKVVNHIISKCGDKFEGKFGLRYLSKKN